MSVEPTCSESQAFYVVESGFHNRGTGMWRPGTAGGQSAPISPWSWVDTQPDDSAMWRRRFGPPPPSLTIELFLSQQGTALL